MWSLGGSLNFRVATKWVSGYFAKYEIRQNKTFFSRNFGGIL